MMRREVEEGKLINSVSSCKEKLVDTNLRIKEISIYAVLSNI
jgi:hypothetical protein